MDEQLKSDFADIEEMLAQNRRANYERAMREVDTADLQRRLEAAESSRRYWRGNFLVLAIAVIGVMIQYVVVYMGAR